MSKPSPTTAPSKEVFISYVRGFSMLSIVVHHYMKKVAMHKLLYTAFFFGGSGIHAFIFISGYGLGLSRVTNWTDFYRKRFRKVLLPYYIGVTMIFLVNLLFPIYGDDWGAYVSHLLLYKMFIERYNVSFGGHFWFISTIVQLYVLFPLISWFVARNKPLSTILIAVLFSLGYSLFLLTVIEPHERIWTCSALQFSWEFVLGMVVARERWLPALLRQSWFVYGFTVIIGIAGTVLLVNYAGATGRQFNDYFAFVGYLSGCILLYKLSNRQFLLTWLNRFVLWIEPFSYSLFITHILVLDAYTVVVGRPNLLLSDFLFLGPALLLVALAFHRVTSQLLERKAKPAHQPVALR